MDDLCPGKHCLELLRSDQPDFSEPVVNFFLAGPGEESPGCRVPDHFAAQIGGQPVHERRQIVRFYKKPRVRGLYPVAFPDARNLFGEADLGIVPAQMFDHGVGKDNIEFLVLKGQMTTITHHPTHIRGQFCTVLFVHIENGNVFDGRQSVLRSDFPDEGVAANIQNFGLWRDRLGAIELLHARLAKVPEDRTVDIVDIHRSQQFPSR